MAKKGSKEEDKSQQQPGKARAFQTAPKSKKRAKRVLRKRRKRRRKHRRS